MRTILSLLVVAGASAVAACAVNYEDLRVTGSEFDKALYDGYRALADSEYAQGDGRDGRVYAQRAVASAGGNRPEPEAIAARELPEETVGELTDARNSLAAALSGGAADSAPKDAAQAQVMFDCWMEQQEENFQPEDIAACRDGFKAAMAKIGAPAAKPVAAAPAPVPAAKPKQFVVYFDIDSASLSPEGRQSIAAIKEQAGPDTKLLIRAHADRAGPAEYNRVLAAKRASTVFSALKDVGINAKVETSVYGEERNAVPTADGVPERRNRRVEISVVQ